MPVRFETPGIPPCPAGRSLARHLVMLILVAAGTTSLTGCAGFRVFGARHQADPLAGIPRPRFSDDPQMEEVVDHLNRNVQKLHAWRANTVKIRANNMPLSGTLAVEEGQHLRLVVHSIAGNEVDMGSNDDLFWIWAKRMEPSYVYCRHEQIDAARQTLGVPFEPQWLMQALGVAPLDTKDLTMQIDSTSRRARLFQPVVTAHGFPMQKVMLVDLTHGVVLEHSIYNAANQKIAQARLEEFHVDKRTGIVLPRRVKLDWPQNQMSLVMHLGQVEINPASIPSQIWEMPRMSGVQMVDLGAESRPGIRIAERDRDSSAEPLEPEEASGDGHGGEDGRTKQAAGPHQSEERPNRKDRSSLVDPVKFAGESVQQPLKRNWFDE